MAQGVTAPRFGELCSTLFGGMLQRLLVDVMAAGCHFRGRRYIVLTKAHLQALFMERFDTPS
jgi:hypothetical protein